MHVITNKSPLVVWLPSDNILSKYSLLQKFLVTALLLLFKTKKQKNFCKWHLGFAVWHLLNYSPSWASMAINKNRDSDSYHSLLGSLLYLDWFYTLPTLMFLRASSCYNGASLCCSQGLPHNPQCSSRPLSTPHTLYLLYTPMVQPLQERKLNAFSQESDSCYMHLVHGTWCKIFGPFTQGSDLGGYL